MRTFSDRARARSAEPLELPRPSLDPTPPVAQQPRAQRILQWIWEQITFKRLVLAAIGVPLAIYLCWDATRHFVVLDPIVVPKQFADSGLTSEVMTQRVREKLEEIQRTDESASAREQLSMQADRNVPDIEIPETKLSLRVLSDALRKVLHNDPKHLSGEIILNTSGKMEIRSRLLQSGELVQAGVPREFESTDADQATEMLSRDLTELTDPYLLGMYLKNTKDFPAASEVAKRMLYDRPDTDRTHTKAYLLQGFIASDQGRLDEAMHEDQTAIQLDPQWAYPHHCLGRVLDDQHKLDEAASEYQRAIQLDPKYAAPHVNLGAVLYDQHKLDEAAVEDQRAIQLDPKNALPHSNLGNVLLDQHKPDGAATEYQRAIQLDPKLALPHVGLGNVLSDQHKPDGAATEYQRAIQLDPKYAAAHFNLGLLLQGQHKLDEAAAEYQTAIQLDPKDADSHHNLQLLLQEQGKPDQAEVERKAAHELDPAKY